MHDYNLGIRFQRIASEQAQHEALWFDEHERSRFAELNSAANRIARLLLKRGLNSGDVVLVSGQKSVETFAAMLACLKIGVIYAVFDYDSPIERLRRIVSTCQPKLIIGDESLTSEFGDIVVSTFATDAAGLDGANLNETNQVVGSDPAYIMFTSGSTGFPKGAVMTHQNVLNLINWSASTFSITKDDALTNVNPMYFDNSVFDFYAALFNGATLVPFSKEEVQDPQRLVEKVDARKCSVWFSVPSLLMFLQTMRAADGQHLRSISRFIFGGEGYPKAKLKALFEAYGSSTLFNVYGPTECTCICSCYQITASDFEDLTGLPSLGHIAENFTFLVLDSDENPVIAGDIGELCLLGPNVGNGYYRSPELTAQNFKLRNGELMYKTGDLVRQDPADGKLWIHGRKDNQIKHMGYRIELEEIESALHRLNYITEAAAIHTEVNGLSRIIAVVATTGELNASEIRRDLKQYIPDYMIPHTFYRELVLTKNASGKVDRHALREKYSSAISASV
jgi:D-alanine--poly(phosphoribitol) ligase subunit 1